MIHRVWLCSGSQAQPHYAMVTCCDADTLTSFAIRMVARFGKRMDQLGQMLVQSSTGLSYIGSHDSQSVAVFRILNTATLCDGHMVLH